MSLPRIAIVGRPNVGKSSLANMLAKERVSIVDSTPGVTRDRVSCLIEVRCPLRTGPAKIAEVVDTGGFGIYTAEGARFNEIGEDLSRLSGAIEEQIGFAAREADLILFIVDAQAGITALDETFAKLLRENLATGRPTGATPVRVVANKVDGDNWEAHAYEAAALGFGEPLLISATNRFRRNQFLDDLFEAIPEQGSEESRDPTEMRVAIVGKRNAGKSTLTNALAQEERVIVSEIAGTTRDAVDVRFEIDGRACIAIDTAGLRKRKSIPDRVEWFARDRALRSIERADVVLLMIDATTSVSQVDKNLTKEISDRHKPCVLVVNKWDLARDKIVKGRRITTDDYLEYLSKELRGLPRAPIVFSSATTGQGVLDVMKIAFELRDQASLRISTGELNRTFERLLEERGPSSRLGRVAKIFYATQVATNPPTIVIVTNAAEQFEGEYHRYLLNRLAEMTPFSEVPINLIFRDRKRVSVAELHAGEHKKLIESDDA